MTGTLDLAKLTLQDALDIAIIIEEEARDRYEELADQLEQHRTPDAAKFFRAMVQNEDKHAEQLKAHRKKACGTAPAQAATRKSIGSRVSSYSVDVHSRVDTQCRSDGGTASVDELASSSSSASGTAGGTTGRWRCWRSTRMMKVTMSASRLAIDT